MSTKTSTPKLIHYVPYYTKVKSLTTALFFFKIYSPQKFREITFFRHCPVGSKF